MLSWRVPLPEPPVMVPALTIPGAAAGLAAAGPMLRRPVEEAEIVTLTVPVPVGPALTTAPSVRLRVPWPFTPTITALTVFTVLPAPLMETMPMPLELLPMTRV